MNWSSIPIPSREIELDLRVVLILFSLSSAMLASWLRTCSPGAERWLPIGWYGIVLGAIAAASYAMAGISPQLTSASTPLWLSVLIGLLLGGLTLAVEAGISRANRKIHARRLQSRPAPRGPAPLSLADVPTSTEVVWRLRASGPWRSGLGDLVLIAVLEECIYRQTLLALLAPVFGGPLLPALLSTLGFGLMHIYSGWSGVISKTLIGGMYMVAVLAGAGLVAAILAHCILNVSAFAVRSRAAVRRPAFG